MKHSIAILALAGSGLLLASQAGAATDRLPQTHTEGAVVYTSGGVGEGQASAMKSAAAQYPLELEFLQKAQPKDEYLANIKVQIKDSHDKTVLDTTSNGPFLLAKLPPGAYSIGAENGGKWEHRNVSIADSGHKRLVFEWAS